MQDDPDNVVLNPAFLICEEVHMRHFSGMKALVVSILVIAAVVVLNGSTPLFSSVHQAAGENSPASIVVAKPNGGQRVTPGTKYTIRWQAKDVSTVAIDYSVDGGNTWINIVRSAPAVSGERFLPAEVEKSRYANVLPEMGSYLWNVPQLESENVLIRVSDDNHPTLSDVSDGSFALTYQPLSGWSTQSVGASVTLSKVSIVDDLVAWTSAIGGSVFRTTNGGTNWLQTQSVPGDGRGIFGVSESTAFVCVNFTNDGRAYRTTDAGQTWTLVLQHIGTGAGIVKVHMFDENSGMALGDPVGGFWRIFKTTDTGETWDTIAQVSATSFDGGYHNAVDWFNNHNGWFGSSDGGVYRTQDDGKTWDFSIPASSGLDVFGLAFVSKNLGIASTVFRVMYKTTDGGASWTLASTVPGTPTIICFIASAITPAPCWWVTNMDEIYRSTNQGATWIYDALLDGIPFNDIAMKVIPEENLLVGYAVGAGGGMLMKFAQSVVLPPPIFNVSQSSIAFGNIHVDSSDAESVLVTNTGIVALNISSVTSDHPEFSVTPGNGTVPPGGSKTFSISFHPTTSGSKTGNIVFSHNASSSPDSVAVNGTGTADTITIGIPIRAGWNTVSNPVTASNESVSYLYPNSIFSYAFGFNQFTGYYQSSSIPNGKGYFAKFPSAYTNFISGEERLRDSIGVSAGWNIIGSISCIVDTSAVITIPSGIRASNYFGFDSTGFVVVTQLEPGRGYLVKSSEPGNFILQCPGVSGQPFSPSKRR